MKNSDKPLTGQAVVIAAGESSRFWPLSSKHKHKSQTRLLGKSLVYWTMKGLAENGVKDFIIVRNPHSSIKEQLEEENILPEAHPFSGYLRTFFRGPGRSRSLTREEAFDAFSMILRDSLSNLTSSTVKPAS